MENSNYVSCIFLICKMAMQPQELNKNHFREYIFNILQ